MPVIEREWESFSREVLPADASPIQRQECKRAFYAGACSLFSAILNIMDPSSEDATERDLLAMDSIQRELEGFMQSVRAGRN